MSIGLILITANGASQRRRTATDGDGINRPARGSPKASRPGTLPAVSFYSRPGRYCALVRSAVSTALSSLAPGF
jgi:hypothetical protein